MKEKKRKREANEGPCAPEYPGCCSVQTLPVSFMFHYALYLDMDLNIYIGELELIKSGIII